MSIEEPAPPQARWRNRLFPFSAACLAAVEIYYGFTADVRDPLHLQLGLVIIFLACLPALLWAKRARGSLPVFEVLMFTSANLYALPLLNGHKELLRYTIDDITTAAFGIVIFQCAALAAHELVHGRKSLHPFWREEIISSDLSRRLMHGMALNTAYVLISTFTDLVPHNIGSILRAVFFGIGIICTFITARRMGAGELSTGEKTFFFITIVLQCLGMLATLFLVGTVSMLLLALVGYVSGSGRVPLLACGLSVLALGILHNGKSAMRDKYWDQDERRIPTVTALPGFFSDWISEGLKKDDENQSARVANKLIERTSLFHMICLVVSATPAQQPYLNGETYAYIPGQFIPRLFWPDKPPGHVSTSRLSVYYGLQTEEETARTTIGFGMIAEAYANFGFFGIGAIGAFLAFWIKKIQCWAQDGPLLSYGGILLVILLAWSFQTEFTLSIWLSSFFQACVAVLGVPFLLRKFIHA
jgi:hypothetical protein